MGDNAYEGAKLFWLPDATPTSRVAYAGAPQTIDVMRKAVLGSGLKRFDTRKLCEILCEGVASKDYTSEYLAIYYCMLQRARYMRDPKNIELVRAPYVISEQILAGHVPSLDCDDMATWIAEAVIAMGGYARFVTAAFANQFYEGRRQYSHVFTQAQDPRTKQWITLDPVAAEKTKAMLARVVAAETWPIAA